MTDIDTSKGRELLAGVPRGDWEAFGTGVARGDHWHVFDANGEAVCQVSSQDGCNEAEREPIANLIVWLRNHAEELIAAVEAVERVREVHRKAPIYEIEAGECEHGDECEGVEIEIDMTFCPGSIINWTCSECAECAEWSDEMPDWPCDTIRALDGAE